MVLNFCGVYLDLVFLEYGSFAFATSGSFLISSETWLPPRNRRCTCDAAQMWCSVNTSSSLQIRMERTLYLWCSSKDICDLGEYGVAAKSPNEGVALHSEDVLKLR